MLIDVGFYFPVSLAMFQDVFHAPSTTEVVRIALRWFHIAGGITWIGLLYFFNLVNVPFQKNLDPETKKKVNPDLLSRALWWFRWSALLTVLVGLTYFAMYMLPPAINNANTRGANVNVWLVLLAWLTYPVVLFVVEFLIIKKVPALTKDGRVFGLIVLILIVVTSYGLIRFFASKLTVGDYVTPNSIYSIGLGGAYGIFMLLNVWGIIWPNNKRIIAGTAGTGPAAPPELARQAFLASRTNAWLSLPMILFMATSEHDWFIFGGQ
jgi:uncharacterized membrane protein